MPLRLRGVAVLAVGAVGALAVTGWVFAQDTLTKDGVPIGERATSGHELGVAVLVMALVLLAAGLAMGFAAARRAPSEPARKRAGAAILVALGLVPVVLVVALAMSSQGPWRLASPADGTPSPIPTTRHRSSTIRAG